jgi:hypothetical protein
MAIQRRSRSGIVEEYMNFKVVKHMRNCVKCSGVTIIDNEVTINGVKIPPCPGKGHSSTIINNKVYLNGYELIDGEWKKTLRALWYKWF